MWLEGLELGRRKDRWRGKVVWSHASGRVSQLRPLKLLYLLPASYSDFDTIFKDWKPNNGFP